MNKISKTSKRTKNKSKPYNAINKKSDVENINLKIDLIKKSNKILLFIVKFYHLGVNAFFKYLISKLQSLYPCLTVFRYFSVGNLNEVFFTMV